MLINVIFVSTKQKLYYRKGEQEHEGQEPEEVGRQGEDLQGEDGLPHPPQHPAADPGFR